MYIFITMQILTILINTQLLSEAVVLQWLYPWLYPDGHI